MKLRVNVTRQVGGLTEDWSISLQLSAEEAEGMTLGEIAERMEAVLRDAPARDGYETT